MQLPKAHPPTLSLTPGRAEFFRQLQFNYACASHYGRGDTCPLRGATSPLII